MSAAGTLARFARDFGVPFLMGGKCRIGDPLGRPGLNAVRHGLTLDAPLQDACDAQFVEAALWTDITPAPFDHDAATFLCAAHELFSTTHPQATSFYARTHLFAKAATQAINDLPHTLDPARLITRHLIARRMFRTNRTDIHVKWWTGNASFYGDEPPKRLTAWPGLRRVNQQRLTQPMWRLAMSGGDEELRVARQALMAAVLDQSPLTRLMFAGDPLQKNLGFSLLLPWKHNGRRVSPLDCLEDRRLARAVVDKLLEDGLDVAGPAVALAMLQGLREGTSPYVLRRAAELCTHLAIMACLIEGEAPGSRESKPLVAFVDGDPASLNEANRVYWAVVRATLALGFDGVLDPPPLESLSPGARAVLERLYVRLGHQRVAAVADPLLRELKRRLPKPGTVVPEAIGTSGSSETELTDGAPSSPDAAIGEEASRPAVS